MTPPNSILITRLSAIGDVVHALPVLDAVRTQLPKARIGWLVEELSAPLLQHHPQLDKLYIIPKKRWRGNFRRQFRREIAPFFKGIRADGWEASLDLQGLSKSAIAARASGAKLRVGFGGENAREISWLLYNRRVIPHDSDVHVVAKNLRLLEGLGLSVPETPPRGMLGLLEEEKESLRGRLRENGWRGEPLLALNPGAGWASKRWPPEHFAGFGKLLAKETGCRPLVAWGPKEEPLRDAILEGLKGFDPISAPPTSVRELAVLISLCSLFVGGDTGASHLCGVLGVPVISIFGSSDAARNQPWPVGGPHPAGVVVQRKELKCVPCWKKECSLQGEAHLACLLGLTPEKAFERIQPWLKTFAGSSE